MTKKLLCLFALLGAGTAAADPGTLPQNSAPQQNAAASAAQPVNPPPLRMVQGIAPSPAAQTQAAGLPPNRIPAPSVTLAPAGTAAAQGPAVAGGFSQPLPPTPALAQQLQIQPQTQIQGQAAAVPGQTQTAQPQVAAPLVAAVQAAVPQDDPSFPHLPILRPQVEFWTKVFSEYSENQSVVHSIDDVRKVYVVLDFTQQAQTFDAVQLSLLKGREESRAKQQIDDLLKRVDALQDTPEKMDADEHRVYMMYADSRDPHRFREAIGSFRVQRGLRERTAHALQVAGRYLPQMEQIFASYGLPTRLTRLPLVESSFNLQAYSKVGAAGLWQFMPSSARIYMRLDEIADDRRDPWFSTDAAARHLRDDYAALQSWPLAVTAYNHGRGGVARGLAKVNGTGLDDLLQRYDGDSFGFASRNFYAEFLAASDVERDWRKHFGDLQRDAPTQFETVETRDYVPYGTLQRLSNTDATTFRTLNPAYNDEVIDGRLYVPPGHLIRVPAGAADRFKLAYASLGPDQRFEHQRQYYVLHRLERGESIAKLSHRFGVSQQAILAANGLRSNARLRAGSTVKIPPHDAPSTVVASADTPEPHVLKASVHAAAERKAAAKLRLHKVKSGQTLGAIAKRYQTSVSALRQVNGLGNADRLRVGSMLKIPGN
ncbi:LysM peptidoglycan-binding domain-containing protein [Nevskia soli]|uniref:LysM peptidoglycan-binding domain-containing protein n=1 Tax=Nevskia soli TaxID=418856 RepID=UPI0012FC9E02|nr:LysM peptidoglycan-binding domain-containing protein [Nevskia soli]